MTVRPYNSPTVVRAIVHTAHSSINHQNRELRVASDAAFADNPQTRKSLQGQIIMLFGGAGAGRQASKTQSRRHRQKQSFLHSLIQQKKPLQCSVYLSK
jgi:hypothetical protein